MLSKNKIKLIQSLDQKKFRTEHKLFIVEGEKICNDLIASQFEAAKGLFEIAEIYYTLAWKQNHLEDLEDFNIEDLDG